jgi:hypothetical protein
MKIKQVLFLVILGYLVQCTNQKSQEMDLIFIKKIVDGNPPAREGCCLDVCAVGDIDGDGIDDIMVGSENSIGIVWYHSPSNQPYPIAQGSFTTDGEIFDMDGDGDGDVVISCISRDQIEWWENSGDPFNDVWEIHKIGDLFAHDLSVGDINGDRRPDVVVFRKGRQPQLTVFLAPRDKNENWERIQIATPEGEGLDLGDVDGDGDLDIAASRQWYENSTPDGKSWIEHIFTSNWGVDCRNIVADMNNDGLNDIVLSFSEGEGRVSWFENPDWIEHHIETGILVGAHSLEVADFNQDGFPDVLTGEMHTSPQKRVIVYQNLEGEGNWKRNILDSLGTHNARVGDVDGDGDPDIIGKNYDGTKTVDLWENQNPPHPKFSPRSWTYIEVDNNREAFPDRMKAFGLALGDLTGDGLGDIVSGRYFYRNPGGDMTGKWSRITFPETVDAVLILDVDGDEFGDVIGQAYPDVLWLEALDQQGSEWKSTIIGSIPRTGHRNGQGYAVAQLIPGGKPEIILKGGSRDSEVYYFVIPETPDSGNWQQVLITDESTDEGIGVADVDGDGDFDICGGGDDGKSVGWWENPGNGQGNWQKYLVGSNNHWADRFALGDINLDGKPDIVMSEEWRLQVCRTYWYEQPKLNPKRKNWIRHTIAAQFTTNSMDVADMDEDGDLDVITGEHRGKRRLTIWENINQGSGWIEHVISQGKESHLGTRLFDLDGDGDLDIASISWDTYQYLHLWRNDSK